MDNKFSLSMVNMQKLQTVTELRECNDYTLRFGLSLTEEQIHDLTEKRFEALKDTGRVEFGKGILKKLVCTFCDSPYITTDNYEEMILELQDAFYYFKNESMDSIPDDELIDNMKRYFDTVCEGSLEYLFGTSLETLCHDTRYEQETKDTDIDIYGHLF